MAFCVLGAIALIGYPLGPARHAEIRRQLDERDRSEADEDRLEAAVGVMATLGETQPASEASDS